MSTRTSRKRSGRLGGVLNRLTAQPATTDWAALAGKPPRPGPDLDRLRKTAREQRRALDRFLIASDPAVMRGPAGLAGLFLPPGTDWRWRPPALTAAISPPGMARPESGAWLDDFGQVFHDCDERALILRQIRNRRSDDPANFAIAIETFCFTGSFLSLAIPLPPEACTGLGRSHVLRVALDLDLERRIGIAVRLNIRNGPNTDQLQEPLEGLETGGPNRQLAEFDLADTEIDETRIESAWIDLLLIDPAATATVLREMVVSRHPRAEI